MVPLHLEEKAEAPRQVLPPWGRTRLFGDDAALFSQCLPLRHFLLHKLPELGRTHGNGLGVDLGKELLTTIRSENLGDVLVQLFDDVLWCSFRRVDAKPEAGARTVDAKLFCLGHIRQVRSTLSY